MVKLSYETLNNPMFIEGLRKLVNTPFHLKQSYWIGRMQEKVMNESKKARLEWVKILNEKVEWEGEGADRVPKHPGQLMELEKEFLTKEFDLGKCEPLDVQNLDAAQLTALEVMALKPILTGLELLGDDGGENEQNEKGDNEENRQENN